MRDRTKRRPPSYYKKYVYPKKRFLVTVVNDQEQVTCLVYTDTVKSGAADSARKRLDVIDVLSSREITEEEFQFFLEHNPDHRNTTSRKKKNSVTEISLPKTPTNQ